MIKIETKKDYQEKIQWWAATPKNVNPQTSGYARLIFLRSSINPIEILTYAYHRGIIVDVSEFNEVASVVTFVGHIGEIF